MWFWICPECKHKNWGGNMSEEQHCDRCNYIHPPIAKTKTFSKITKTGKKKEKHICYDKIMTMRSHGMSYREIGNIIGYSYQTIYNIANGK